MPLADMSVASCIYPLRFKGNVIVKRRSIGAIVKGVQQENPPQVFTIIANVQSANGEDLKHLPEGDRTTDSISVHTETFLQTADVQDGQLADHVVWQGDDFKVMKVFDRTANDTFYVAICVKVGQ